jgi:putative phosphoesterase
MKTLSLTLSHPYPVQIAVISDTHTSAQKPEFHPLLLPRLTTLKPDYIFHAGDITLPESLVCLQEIAPTYAVKGNRDLFGFSDLPGVIEFSLGDHKILMAHGHGPLIHYLMDKAQYMVNGYRFERYKEYLVSVNSVAAIYIFGHTHIPVHQWMDGKLFMNPGTSGYPTRGYPHPTIGWIRIQEDGSIQSEIQYLEHPDKLFPQFG